MTIIELMDNATIYNRLLEYLQNKKCICKNSSTDIFVFMYYDKFSSYVTIRCSNCVEESSSNCKGIKLSDKEVFYLKCTNRI